MGMISHDLNSWDCCIRSQWHFSHLGDEYSLSAIGNLRLTLHWTFFPFTPIFMGQPAAIWLLLMSNMPECSKGFQLKQPVCRLPHTVPTCAPMRVFFYVVDPFWLACSFFCCVNNVCLSFERIFFYVSAFHILFQVADTPRSGSLTVVQFRVKW